MDPPYRRPSYGEFEPDERDEHYHHQHGHHHHLPDFHNRPPPPPPFGEPGRPEGFEGYGAPPPFQQRPEFEQHYQVPDPYQKPSHFQYEAPPACSDPYTSHDAKPSYGFSGSEPVKSSVSAPLDSVSSDLPQGRLVRIFCKENSRFNLAVVNNMVSMEESNTEDEAQQWIKDMSHGLRIKDSYGYPAFTLINKKTRKMLKHENQKGQQVLLVDYQPGLNDDNLLWTESQEFEEGFKTVRSASDTLLNLTIFEGNKRIRIGSALVLDTWHKGGHQLWKLFPL